MEHLRRKQNIHSHASDKVNLVNMQQLYVSTMKDSHYYSVECSLCSRLLCSTFSICPSTKSSVSRFVSICFVNLASADKKKNAAPTQPFPRLPPGCLQLQASASSPRSPPPSTLLLTSSISLLSALDPPLLLHSLHTHLHSAASLLISELKTSHYQTIPSLSHAFSEASQSEKNKTETTI